MNTVFNPIPTCPCLPQKRSAPRRRPTKKENTNATEWKQEVEESIEPNDQNNEEELELEEEEESDEDSRPVVVVVVVNSKQNQFGDYDMPPQPNCFCTYNEQGIPCQCQNSYYPGAGGYPQTMPYGFGVDGGPSGYGQPVGPGPYGHGPCGCPTNLTQQEVLPSTTSPPPLSAEATQQDLPESTVAEEKSEIKPILSHLDSQVSILESKKSTPETKSTRESYVSTSKLSKKQGESRAESQRPSVASVVSKASKKKGPDRKCDDKFQCAHCRAYYRNAQGGTDRFGGEAVSDLQNLSVEYRGVSPLNNDFTDTDDYCTCEPTAPCQQNMRNLGQRVDPMNGENYEYGKGGRGQLTGRGKKNKNRRRIKKKYKKLVKDPFKEFARFPKGPILVAERVVPAYPPPQRCLSTPCCFTPCLPSYCDVQQYCMPPCGVGSGGAGSGCYGYCCGLSTL